MTPNETTITIEIEPQPDWEHFVAWGLEYLANHQLNQGLEVIKGADRHMLYFTFGHARFSLNYENYSESIWIAPQDQTSEAMLEPLKAKLHSAKT